MSECHVEHAEKTGDDTTWNEDWLCFSSDRQKDSNFPDRQKDTDLAANKPVPPEIEHLKETIGWGTGVP